MQDVELTSAIPVLASLDIPASVAFYRDKLGFAEAFVYPDYAGVERGPVQLHFWRCDDASIPKVTSCRVNVRGVDALYAEADAAGVVHPGGPLADKPWGFREFTALDLHGNAVVFAEPIESAG